MKTPSFWCEGQNKVSGTISVFLAVPHPQLKRKNGIFFDILQQWSFNADTDETLGLGLKVSVSGPIPGLGLGLGLDLGHF